MIVVELAWLASLCFPGGKPGGLGGYPPLDPMEAGQGGKHPAMMGLYRGMDTKKREGHNWRRFVLYVKPTRIRPAGLMGDDIPRPCELRDEMWI